MTSSLRFVSLCCFASLAVSLRRHSQKEARDNSGEGELQGVLTDMIGKLGGGVVTSRLMTRVAKNVSKGIPKEMDDLVDDLARSGTCSSAWGKYGLSELKNTMKQSYKKRPFSCLKGGKQVNVDSALKLFGQRARMTKTNALAKFSAACVLRDITDKYGKAHGFTAWNKQSFSKFTNMQSVLTKYYKELVQLGKKDINQWDNLTFGVLGANFKKFSPLYMAARGEIKGFLYEFLKKLFLISMGPQMVHKYRNNPSKLQELGKYRPASLADNIQWAVNYENNGVKKKHAAADPENVELGRHVKQLFGHCIKYSYRKKVPHLQMEAQDDLLDRAIALYTIWNYRYVTYFMTQNPALTKCSIGPLKRKHKWTVVPHVIAHGVLSLIASMNEGGPLMSSWGTYRPISLMMAGAGLQQTCKGKVSAFRGQ